MGKRLDWDVICTRELLQEELLRRNSTVILTSDLIKCTQPIQCLCSQCGYTWEATPSNLIKPTGCAKCAKRVIPTLAELQDLLDSLNRNVVVSGSYESSYDKLDVVCKLCNYEWVTFAANLKSKTFACKGCRTIEKKDKAQAEHQALVKDLEAMGKDFTLLSNFKTRKSHIDFMCNICGYKDKKIPLHLRLHGCYNCSHLKKLSLDEVQLRLDSQDKKIKVTGEYVNTSTHLSCECLVCANTWEATPGSLRRTGCPSCADYGFTPSKPGYLYYIRINHQQDVFWKVGITNVGVKDRFPAKDRKFMTVLYCHLFEDGHDAINAEKNILRLFKEYKAHNINLLSSGNTELFTKDVLQMDHLFWGPI